MLSNKRVGTVVAQDRRNLSAYQRGRFAEQPNFVTECPQPKSGALASPGQIDRLANPCGDTCGRCYQTEVNPGSFSSQDRTCQNQVDSTKLVADLLKPLLTQD